MNPFLRNQKGSVLVLGAFMLPVLFGFCAFAVDLSNLYYNKSRIQMAADAAALGAVLSLPDAATVTSKALDLVAQNAPSGFGTIARTQDVTLGIWNTVTKTFTATSTNPNAVQVSTHRTVANGNPIQTYFGKFVGSTLLEVNAKSTAVRFGGACVRILDTSASNAFYDSGNGSATMNCPLQVDSSASSAARTQGSSSVIAKSACIVGGYSGNGWSPTPTTGCKRLGDPLAFLPEPAAPATPCNFSSSGTIASNCTATGTVSLSGSPTLQSGLYYFKSANITLSNSTNLTGSGVTIFLDANSSLSLGGGGTISLTAASSGTYAGVLIFQSRSAPASRTLSVGGSGTLSLDGTLYVPSATLSISGNGTFSASAQLGYVIADKLSIGGSGDFVFNAFPTNGATPRTLRVHAGLVS